MIRMRLVEQHRADFGKSEGSPVKIAKRPYPLLLSQEFGAGGDIRDQQIEQVERVIQGFRCIGISKCHQGRGPPVLRHPRNICRPTHCRIAGERF